MGRCSSSTRHGDPEDRRVVQQGALHRFLHVTLTPAGAKVYRRAGADHRAAVADRFLQHVSADEAVVIEEALRRVRDENAG